jgi:hypothetical protein
MTGSIMRLYRIGIRMVNECGTVGGMGLCQPKHSVKARPSATYPPLLEPGSLQGKADASSSGVGHDLYGCVKYTSLPLYVFMVFTCSKQHISCGSCILFRHSLQLRISGNDNLIFNIRSYNVLSHDETYKNMNTNIV